MRGTLAELATRFAEGSRGEVCLIVEGAPEREVDAQALDAAIRAQLDAGTSARDTASTVAAAFTVRKSAVYQRVLELMRTSRR